MKLKCPACGAVASLDVLLSHDGARDAVLAAGQLPPPLAKLVFQYLGLFRPAKRELSFDRLATLLSELVEPISQHQVQRHGRIWPATDEMWSTALADMLTKRDAGKLDLPLKSHGYLFEVVASYSNRQEAKEESRTEQDRRYPYSVARNTDGPVGIGQAVQTVLKNQSRDGINRGREALRAAMNRQQGESA